MLQRTLGILLAAVIAGGCIGNDDSKNAEARSSTSQSKPTTPAPGATTTTISVVRRVRINVFTHCGVHVVDIDGAHYAATPPLGQGTAPGGWGNPFESGTMTIRSDGTATFVTVRGERARFTRVEEPPRLPGCD